MPANTATKRESDWYYILLVLAVIYVAGITFTNFANWDAIWAFLYQKWQLTPNIAPVINFFYNIRLTNDIVYPGIGKVFFAGLMLCGLWAGFGLSKGRSFAEALGLFLLYTIPRPNYYWGKITDKDSGVAIPFSKVEVRKSRADQVGLFVKETIADMFGRYRINFSTEPRFAYTVHFLANDYQPFIKKVNLDLDQNVTIYNDVALVPASQILSPLSKGVFQLRTWLNSNIVKILYLISGISLAVITSGLIQSVQSWTIFYFSLAFAAFVWNSYVFFIYNKQRPGRFILLGTNQPVDNLFVNLFRKGSKVASAATNGVGEISFSVDPGEYDLQVLSQGFALIIDDQEISGRPVTVQINDKGFLVDNVYLREKESSGGEGNLINPFA